LQKNKNPTKEPTPACTAPSLSGLELYIVVALAFVLILFGLELSLLLNPRETIRFLKNEE
jgi:hypothetical protein